tara:strand:+ start:116 stop:283 length:168 start_codon:yes stop_codon:yes gene_type:complete
MGVIFDNGIENRPTQKFYFHYSGTPLEVSRGIGVIFGKGIENRTTHKVYCYNVIL